jgi:hypothetical protein
MTVPSSATSRVVIHGYYNANEPVIEDTANTKNKKITHIDSMGFVCRAENENGKKNNRCETAQFSL